MRKAKNNMKDFLLKNIYKKIGLLIDQHRGEEEKLASLGHTFESPQLANYPYFIYVGYAEGTK